MRRIVFRWLILAILFATAIGATFAAGQTEATESAEGGGQLEIMSWWTTGGEVLGLEALFDVYHQKYPNVEIVNAAVAGSKGVNARAVLATRMQGGDPPDSFQVLGGGALKNTWVVSGQLEPVTFIYKENNWLKVFPKQVVDQVSYKDEMYAVPVNIHRTNILWYNKPIFTKYNLDPPSTLDEFFKTAETLAAKGIIPLAFGSKAAWEPIHLLESVIVAEIGPQGYRGLFNGTTKWDSPAMVQVFRKYAKMLDYINRDHSGLTGADQAQYVVDGKCAMCIMGDWIAGYYAAKNYVPHVDYEWATAPGTKGSYLMNCDTFVLPKGPINRDLAIAWLEVVGSREGQDAFNPKKGSIPARVDADTSLYSEYHKGAMKDFSTNELLPSLAHGMAVSDAWLQDIGNVMIVFIVDKDVDSAIKQLVEIAKDNL